MRGQWSVTYKNSISPYISSLFFQLIEKEKRMALPKQQFSILGATCIRCKEDRRGWDSADWMRAVSKNSRGWDLERLRDSSESVGKFVQLKDGHAATENENPTPRHTLSLSRYLCHLI